ncbi:MAG: hypothetical protein D6692_02490 [Planctomycetota bacterium]|nr:MAG: hypothetical protein D6692_02490 [Planctomycetota bacterium]
MKMIDVANQDLAFALVALCGATAGGLLVFLWAAGALRRTRDVARRLGEQANWWRHEVTATEAAWKRRMQEAAQARAEQAPGFLRDPDWWNEA